MILVYEIEINNLSYILILYILICYKIYIESVKHLDIFVNHLSIVKIDVICPLSVVLFDNYF